jgi:hypothetical protein
MPLVDIFLLCVTLGRRETNSALLPGGDLEGRHLRNVDRADVSSAFRGRSHGGRLVGRSSHLSARRSWSC